MESIAPKKKITETLEKIDLLECSICCNNLKAPIYQCQFGHALCKDCWMKLGFKCPTCQQPLGVNRCPVLERLIRLTVVRCPNAPACTKTLAYTKIQKHVDYGCVISKVFCSNYILCEQRGDPDWMMDYFVHEHWNSEKYKSYFDFDSPIKLDLIANLEVWYLFCWMSPVLFAFQCFKYEKGVFLDVSYLAPPESHMYHYSYVMSYTYNGEEITYGCSEIARKIRISYEYPEEDTAVFIPKEHMNFGNMNLKLTIYA